MGLKELPLQTSDGLCLWVRSWSPERPQRADVCLIHGLGEHAGRYAHVAAALNEGDIAVHAMDLRGHGKSEGVRGHTPRFGRYLADLQELLEALEIKSPCFIYGHSLGALVALAYALRWPAATSGVIATGAGFRRGWEVPAWKILLAKTLATLWPTFSQRTELNPDDLSNDAQVVRAYREDPLVHDWATARMFVEVTAEGEALLEQADKFTSPLLLMQAATDAITDPSATQLFFDRADTRDKTLRFYPDVRHEIHNDSVRELVLVEIRDWIHARAVPTPHT